MSASSSRASGRERGELAILLHSHMPYVEGFGTWPFGEEWLFEAIASSYVPLVSLLEHLATEGHESVLTVGVTPVLTDQLSLPAVRDRFLRFMRGTRAEGHAIDAEGFRRAGDERAAASLEDSARCYQLAVESFEALGGDLPAALRRLREAGTIDLWASAATHAVLPLLATEAGVRLQVETGIAAHRERFGDWSGGFWLPECAWRDGLDEPLAAAGVDAFCVYRGDTGDPLAALSPVATAAGATAVPIDWETIALVWDEQGYPADPVYRDYHAPSAHGLRPYANGGGAYDAGAALARARLDAADFVARVRARLERFRAERGRPGLAVCALDTELLGHWWHEGPQWLAAVIAEARACGLALAALPEALERHEPRPGRIAQSSWGEGKDLTTWDSSAAAPIVWAARTAELRLVRAMGALPGVATRAGAARAARELLALQSSDWAFMTTRRLAADYPQRRVNAHVAAFERALGTLDDGVTDSRAMLNGGEPVEDAEAALRGLAPALRLEAFAEPSSSWGRPRAARPERACAS